MQYHVDSVGEGLSNCVFFMFVRMTRWKMRKEKLKIKRRRKKRKTRKSPGKFSMKALIF